MLTPIVKPAQANRLGVLISGRGSNLQSIIDAIARGDLQARIAVVISNRADAAGLARAREAGIEAVHLDPRQHSDRPSYDRAIVAALQQREVDLVCLAGFMRLVGAPLLDAFPQRVLNIHPSLLPSFPGLDATAPGARARRAHQRRDRASGDGGAGWRSDCPAVGRAGPRRRHRRSTVGAHPRGGTSPVPGGDSPRARWCVACGRAALRAAFRDCSRLEFRPASSVSSATSGGQLIRIGT